MPTLLVIDDNLAWRSLYRLEFERRFEVWEACDGVEGLSLVESVAPDQVIVDLHMPRMDGFTFLRQLRLNGCRVPVIISTSVLPEEPLPPVPCAGIVEKSPNLAALRSAVQAALSPENRRLRSKLAGE
ncbi:MAG: response regulator [Candidatus Rokubacteria bacterium]|nr:response regulator [Candidatus Rokubacteria bacterium]